MEKVEQIDILGNLQIGYDEKLHKKIEYIEVFSQIFDSVKSIKNLRNCLLCRLDNIKFIVLYANVTYLGNPHPIFKKRIQLKKSWEQIYNEYKDDHIVMFLGVYNYKNNIIFCDFNISDYVNNKMNNSSAHIYTNDLYQSMKKEFHKRIDKNNNTIYLIRKSYFKKYLKKRYAIQNGENDFEFDFIKKINSQIPFNKKINGIDCYNEMILSDYSKKFEAEWPGFYLEFLYENILENEISFKLMTFAKNIEECNMVFDLFSIINNHYSDIKASDINKKETILNDAEQVRIAIEKYGKIWYIIYEHDTKKDSELDFKVTKYWNSQQNIINGKNKDLLSYSKRMKGEIIFRKMFILEINKVNGSKILKDFNQGVQQDGSKRKMKYKIKKNEIENFIIHRYTHKEAND